MIIYKLKLTLDFLAPVQSEFPLLFCISRHHGLDILILLCFQVGPRH